jgi:hypothetical protein
MTGCALDWIEGLPVDWVVPGHGNIGGKEILGKLGNYLTDIRENMKRLVRNGLEKHEAIADESFDRFYQADTQKGLFWGRTDTFRIYGINAAIERIRAYEQTGVDAIFVPGLQKREDLEKIKKNVSLAAITSGLPKTEGGKSGLQILKEIGFCMTVLAKYPFMIVVKALCDSLSYLKDKGELGPFEEKMASTRMLEEIIDADQYKKYQQRFMMTGKNSSIQISNKQKTVKGE